MNESTLAKLSNETADAVTTISPSVVQVQGHRRPASGIVYANEIVLTTTRALGREDGLRVRTELGLSIDAELAGWDPATTLAVLRVPGLRSSPAAIAQTQPRVGHLAIAVARSWSNAVTASFGIVAVIGGPLRTGRGLAIDQVIRTTAPMHDGFAGGAFIDTSGRIVGVATATKIRDLGVIIPASIAWKTAASVLEHGSPKRAFLGIAGQPVRLTERQRGPDVPEHGVVIVSVQSGSPADAAGLLVGDVLLEFDGQSIESPEDLLELLVGDRIGRAVRVRVLRGGEVKDAAVTVGERLT
jgi:S1-C subfamily serine protease